MKNHLTTAAIAFAVSTGVFYGGNQIFDREQTVKIEHVGEGPAKGAIFTLDENNKAVPLDFTAVSKKVQDAVVHIKSTQVASRGQAQRYQQLPDPFRFFFRDQGNGQSMAPQPRVGTGSGVIINNEGYIVTNNHVIDNADDLEVTLHDNRSYKATVIGTDPSTDLALIKIDAKNLPSLPMVNSDDVEVGEWVLAVGNPFNLNSTVTAGIVSAKSRSINILQSKYAVEAFIQTDAAINPGNSGGALVNLQGGLVGINTAIASPTGSYAGYGFAVPSNIVNKVVEDLIKYGTVQRGFLGISIRGVDGSLVKEEKLSTNTGVYVAGVSEESAAGAAGILKGDVITAIDGQEVKTSSELLEQIARRRPGDKLNMELHRGKEVLNVEVELRNRSGETELLAKSSASAVLNSLGAEFEEVDEETAEELSIDGGIKITELHAGKLSRDTQMEEGFIITHVDGQKTRSIDELSQALEGKSGGVLFEGLYPDARGKRYYGIGL